MRNLLNKIRENIPVIALALFVVGVFAISVRINVFRYENFDYGKFDLGNMTQMVWNTLHGRPLYMTDYFGTNLPRWSMSHVDPILLVFVPVFALYQHPLTLVFSQIILVLLSAFVVYKLALLELRSRIAATAFGFAFALYPAVGFLIAWTGFHGVTAVILFFFLAFYTFEKMFHEKKFTYNRLALFWLFLVLTMMGKEQLGLYIIVYGIFIAAFRFIEPLPLPSKETFKSWVRNLWNYTNVKVGLGMVLVGSLWFYLAFFVIIPAYSDLRAEGFKKFADTLGIDPTSVRDVDSDNYFISRYEAFGDTYTEVLIGMITHPEELTKIVFGGDKPDNLKKTLQPMMYTSVLYPPIFLIAFPDFLINYSTSAGGIGTSEIINHRISMIIPVLFISSIYAVGMLANLVSQYSKLDKRYLVIGFSSAVLVGNIYTTFQYNNPIFLWLTQAVSKRIPALAKVDTAIIKEDIKVGDRYRLTKLETKDRECAEKIVEMIPAEASVSGPDYLGAHLSMRETYAIFPALYNEADFVIVDVFSQKILRILDADITLVRDVVAEMIKTDGYKFKLGCGNLFVFERSEGEIKEQTLPLQERFQYEEKADLEIFESLTVVEYEFPQEMVRGEVYDARLAYVKREEKRLDDYVLFMTFINDRTGEIYQVANLPSFALNQLKNWSQGLYFIEDLQIAPPEFLQPGNYKVFIGMSNEIRTRSIYLGDTEIK